MKTEKLTRVADDPHVIEARSTLINAQTRFNDLKDFFMPLKNPIAERVD